MKKIFLVLVILFSWKNLSAGDDFCGIKNTAFNNGEFISYNVFYNVAGIYVNAGTATFTLSNTSINNTPCYHVVGEGRTNSSYDWIEGRLTGRTADRRPWPLRILHAAGFEGGLLLMTLPVIVWWTTMGWIEALVADLGLAAAYTAYAFVFNVAYDRLFPIEPRAH